MKLAEAIEQDHQKRAPQRAAPPNGIPPAKRKCIAVLTPTLGTVSMWWHSAMIDVIWPMNVGKGFMPMIDPHGGEVGEIRNRLVMMALKFEETQGIDLESLMWIDDDVIVSRSIILALASHNRDIVSGVYYSKGDVSEPLIFGGPSSGTLPFQPNKTFEAWGWSQGLSLVRTSVYKRMREELDLGEDKYGHPCWYKQPDFGLDDSGHIILGGTEDFHFFGNASTLGYRPLIDCTKHAFGWHYDLSLKTGYPLVQWNQYLRRENVVWPLPDGSEVAWD